MLGAGFGTSGTGRKEAPHIVGRGGHRTVGDGVVLGNGECRSEGGHLCYV